MKLVVNRGKYRCLQLKTSLTVEKIHIDLTKMAATAYSSLVSLMNVLTRYQNPTCPVPFDQSQIQTLLDKVSSLVKFLEDYYYYLKASPTSRGSIQSLERKMTSVSNAAEDLIETSYVNRVLKREELEIWPDLQNSIQEMYKIIQDSMEVRVKTQENEHQPTLTSSQVHRDKNIMVGFDKQLSRLMGQIGMFDNGLKIIPIVGMGSIGKTTLATNVYSTSYARCHFDIRGWVTISQQYVVKNIIASLLCNMEAGENNELDVEVLRLMLHKCLFGRRYLVVLDDIWDTHVWDEIRRFFPDNKNGSRILLTTRDHRVARRVGSLSPYKMEFMCDDESFNLLSEKVYGKEAFPRELETLGKEIAKSCKGLPLTVVVIGGLLKTSSKTLEHWMEFSKNLSSIICKDDSEQCLGILSLSYTHLPVHLKPCFLYMTTFEEDAKIELRSLINLWIAEGFLKPTTYIISYEIALEYLDDLIDRNLIIVRKKGLTQKIKTVGVHNLLRELCLREAQNENFVCAIEDNTTNLPQSLEFKRRIIYKYSTDGSIVPFPSLLRALSLYQIGYKRKSIRLVCVCDLLRVMNMMNKSKLPRDFMLLVNIRYLAVAAGHGDTKWLLLSLSLFWNLETLILSRETGYGLDSFVLTSKIWELPNLRHIMSKVNVFLPNPTGGQVICVLNNLQTIHNVIDFFCTPEVFRLIPNLKELSISYNVAELKDYDNLSNSFTNLALLQKLEILKVYFISLRRGKRILCELEKLTFSPNLIELELYNSGIPWENMTIIGSLPNLEVLILRTDAFYEDEWNSIDGEFQRLKHLTIDDCHLSTWNAEGCHFPKLEHLELQLWDLKEIPLGIGEIPSIESIKLTTGEMSIILSAKKISEEQKNQGDYDLFITCFYFGGSSQKRVDLENWMEVEKAELKKFVDTDNNFLVFVCPYMI